MRGVRRRSLLQRGRLDPWPILEGSLTLSLIHSFSPPRHALPLHHRQGTNTIVDGHHRHQVIREMGFPLAPVLYIDYGHHDVLVHIDDNESVSKQDVVDCAQLGMPMAPKSTAHVIRAGNGSLHPVVTLSPTCSMFENSSNLTGGWSYKPGMRRRSNLPLGSPQDNMPPTSDDSA